MPTITGTNGNDTLNGTAGVDEINGLAGNDTIDGGDGQDFLNGSDGDDVIHAGAGSSLFPEFIRDGAGNDTVYGEGDWDLIFGSPGDDYYDGGTGGLVQMGENDTVTYENALAPIFVDLRQDTWQVQALQQGDPANIGIDRLINIETIVGSPFGDWMFAYVASVNFFGGEGDDELTGGTGSDSLNGGAGDDVIVGGGESDTASYAGSIAGVTVSLARQQEFQNTGGAGIDILFEIENLAGSSHDDLLIGDDQANWIYGGGGGNDILIGGGGNDELNGDYPDAATIYLAGTGNDSIFTNAFGFDDVEFHAGDGMDKVYDIDSTDIVKIYGYSSAQSITQIGGDIVVQLSATDQINFRFTDLATVQSVLQFVNGTPGNDTLTGGAGDDPLSGGGGNDTINGFGGIDTISGGSGTDTLTGGAGNDVFRDVAANLDGDTITDFAGGDKIVITDATLASFAFSLSGNTLTYTGGSLTLTTPLPGYLTASAAVGGGVQLTFTIIPPLPPHPTTPNVSQTTWIGEGDYTVGEGTQLYAQDIGAVFHRSVFTPSTFTNNGSIWSEAASYPGILGGNFSHVVNNGVAVAQSSAGQLVAFSSTQQSFENNGSIFAIATGGTAFAIHHYSSNCLITNTGLIAASSNGAVYGIRNENGGPVHNLAGGQILVEGAYATAIMSLGGTVGTADEDKPLEIVNEGLIEARATAELSYGIGSVHSTHDRYDIFNSGTIRAGYAIYISGWDGTEPSETVTNTATGWLDGRVNLDKGDDTLINEGRISGLVEMGEGKDKFLGGLGTTSVAVDGGDGNDLLEGGTAGDQLTGSEGDDTIKGGAGIDVLTGGAGADTFRDAAAGLNGDTIADFAAGDRIVISDASLSGFSFSLNSNTLTYTGGSLTLTGYVGPLYASAAPGGGVQLTVAPVYDPRSDFNGDGRSDILWRNDSGMMTNWLGQANGGFTYNDANARHDVSTDWQIAGVGDFNGDNRDDILWRRDSGMITNWLGAGNGGFIYNDANARNDVSTDWQVAGVGDFNGDNRDDILWRRDNGQMTDWLGQANGGFSYNDANALNQIATDWQIAAVGDFNGDNRDDILWRRDSGMITNWLGAANGGFTYNDANARNDVSTDWQIAGVGDFNGDGRDDILWRRDNGQMTNWLGSANGGFTYNDANALNQIATDWHIAGIGDYNGDRRDDILWRNDSGQMTNWLGTASGGFTYNDANARNLIATDWHIQAPDILWV